MAAAVVHAIDEDQAVTAVQPMSQYIVESLARRRFHTVLLGLFGVLALLLAAVGIHGVVADGAVAALARFLSRLLFGAALTDPMTFGAVVFVVTGVAAAACTRPARGARSVDPATILRSE